VTFILAYLMKSKRMSLLEATSLTKSKWNNDRFALQLVEYETHLAKLHRFSTAALVLTCAVNVAMDSHCCGGPAAPDEVRGCSQRKHAQRWQCNLRSARPAGGPRPHTPCVRSQLSAHTRLVRVCAPPVFVALARPFAEQESDLGSEKKT
jgi:hypothetical protein